MARRTTYKQSKHNTKVRQVAEGLKRTGWSVQADLRGFDRPDPIGQYRRIPDIRATKAGAERLIEVETSDSLKKDKKQQSTFRRRAAQKKRTTFSIVVA